MSVNVAIVGSGPSAFYTAEALIKLDVNIRIDIIERLPTPFGLIRGGVAPDHQSTKRVAHAYEKIALCEQFHFYGNVTVGKDISLPELRRLYDAVVLAVGMPRDQPLEIPGADKNNVLGSAEFVGWYNGLPEFRELNPHLETTTVAVIGNGNVALDIARVLVKTETEMATSDIVDYAAKAIRSSSLTDIHTFGRRGPIECKFTNVELREMGNLEDCTPVVDAAQLPIELPVDLSERDRRLKEKNLANFREFSTFNPLSKSKRVHFQFYANPVEILGAKSVEGLKLERTQVIDKHAMGTGEFFEITCGLVVYAIGYAAEPMDGVRFDARTGTVANIGGRIDDGLYAVGWIKRGPTGVIGTNKHDGDAIASQICMDVPTGKKPGREALEKLFCKHGVRAVSYAEWQKINSVEIGAAPPGAPRKKLVTVDEMLKVLS